MGIHYMGVMSTGALVLDIPALQYVGEDLGSAVEELNYLPGGNLVFD